MAEYVYRAVDQKGRAVSGIVEAGTVTFARAQLQKNFRHVIELTPRERSRARTRGVRLGALLLYTQQLSAMIQGAVPLARALDVLSQGDDITLNEVNDHLTRSVMSGRALSSGMMEYPLIFPRIYTSLVATGEASGTLHVVLERLGQLLEWEASMRNRLSSILAYPLALVTLSAGVCSLIVFYILPALQPMFAVVGMELPAPTRFLISITNFCRNPLAWLGALILVALVVKFARMLHRKGSDQPGGARYRTDAFLLHTPLVGRLLWQSFGSRTLYSMALMLDGGLNLNEIFGLLDQSVENSYLRNRLAGARQTLCEGNLLVESLSRHQVFHPLALQLLGAGEEAGRLPEMMKLVAASYEQDLGVTIESVGAVVEPLILAVMGVIIGFICIASLLPVINFVQHV